jgi:hypothetical protein
VSRPERAADERPHLHAPRARHEPALDERLHVLVAQHLGGAVQARPPPAAPRAAPCRVGEEAAEPLPHARAGELGPDHLARQEVLLDEAAERAPMRSLRDGTMAVCGIGMPNGWRNSAVTANQSASPPTIAASAKART